MTDTIDTVHDVSDNTTEENLLENVNDVIIINIFTRSGNRPTFFKTLKDSILKQTYPHIRHVISNDNPKCTYLNNEKYVCSVTKPLSLNNGFYNLYLNELAKTINTGWVVILDDDSKLTNNHVIEHIARHCSNSKTTDVLIYKVMLFPNKTVLPDRERWRKCSIECGGIDMACFCVHYSVFNDVQFQCRCGGDFWFIDDIIKCGKYKFKFVDIPLGIWANYKGARLGKNE